MNKFASICYIPPQSVGYPDAFLANLKNFPPVFPCLLFSYAYKNTPGVIPLRSETFVPPNAKPMALKNLIFFTALRIARQQGITHLLYLETDCRVGCQRWDEIIWTEFCHRNEDAICGGTPVIFNPCSWSKKAALRFERYLAETEAVRQFPIAIAGNQSLGVKHEPTIFTNGALSIYQMDWLLEEFGHHLEHTVQLACNTHTADYEIGRRLWTEFKEDAYDQVTCLGKVFSTYGDVLSTEADRKALLTDGTIVAVHQIKSSWEGPMS